MVYGLVYDSEGGRAVGPPYGGIVHKQKLPSEIVEQVYSGKLRQEVITLETVLKDYVAYKSDTPKAEKEITQRVERLRKDMQHIYGKQKLRYVSLSDISRQDANDLRDHLLSRVSANSAVRMLGLHQIKGQSLIGKLFGLTFRSWRLG